MYLLESVSSYTLGLITGINFRSLNRLFADDISSNLRGCDKMLTILMLNITRELPQN